MEKQREERRRLKEKEKLSHTLHVFTRGASRIRNRCRGASLIRNRYRGVSLIRNQPPGFAMEKQREERRRLKEKEKLAALLRGDTGETPPAEPQEPVVVSGTHRGWPG